MSSDRILQRLRTFLLALSGLICLATPVELAASEHYQEPVQLIPFVLCVFGFIAILVALLRPQRRGLLWLRGVMAALVVGSLVGVVLHISGNLGFAKEVDAGATTAQIWLATFEGAAPMLAPGILALAGALAMAATYHHPLLRAAHQEPGS
jgi:hypothetical protein